MKNPVLSICIATYNRADFIGETLESIIPQMSDEVELLVVDGASTDNTEAVVSEFIKTESRLRYFRLASKGGVDQDYNKTVEFARGEYCWLFTDDDILKEGAIESVTQAIKEKHDVIIVNAEVRDINLSTVVKVRQIDFQQDKLYNPGELEKLFIDAISYLSFIGAVVIKRDVWLARNREKYFGTEFIHVGVIFQEQTQKSIFLISEPYIIIRWGNAQWAPRRFNIWLFKWPNVIWSLSLISDESKKNITAKNPWKSIRTLMYWRINSSYNIQIYNKYLSETDTTIHWKLIAWLIAKSPVMPLVFFRFWKNKIKVFH